MFKSVLLDVSNQSSLASRINYFSIQIFSQNLRTFQLNGSEIQQFPNVWEHGENSHIIRSMLPNSGIVVHSYYT